MPRTLVVDDEVSIRNLLRSLLESAGHQVLLCASGQEAVRALEDEECTLDLMVVDIGLGDMSGLDVVKTCRRTRPCLAVIVISGYLSQDSVELRRELTQEGVEHALSKPFATYPLAHACQVSNCAASEN